MFKRQLEESQPPILERIVSLETDCVKPVDDLKFEQSLFDSKSDSNLSEVVIDIPGLNTFIPKKWIGFSNKENDLFWSLLSEEEKKEFNLLKENKSFDPLPVLLQKELDSLSKKNQSSLSVNTVVDTGTTLSGNLSSGTFQGFANKPITSMANRYAPLVLHVVLNQMPADYSESIKQFRGDNDYTAKQHVQVV